MDPNWVMRCDLDELWTDPLKVTGRSLVVTSTPLGNRMNLHMVNFQPTYVFGREEKLESPHLFLKYHKDGGWKKTTVLYTS